MPSKFDNRCKHFVEHHGNVIEQILAHHPNREGRYVFRALARVWHQERYVIGRRPSFDLQVLGKLLGLDTASITANMNWAEHHTVRMRQARMGGGRLHKKVAWVVEENGSNKIVYK